MWALRGVEIVAAENVRNGGMALATAAAASTGTLWENESHINQQKAFELLNKKYLSRKIN